MTTITAEPTKTAPAKGIQVTEKAIAKIRLAIEQEGVSLSKAACAWVFRAADARA